MTSRYLVVLLTLLGVAVLWEGVRLYQGHLDRIEKPSIPAVAVEPGAPGNRGTRPPNAEEVAALAASDPTVQNSAIDSMFQLQMSPQALQKIDEVVAGNPSPNISGKLMCLKARGPGADRLQLALDWIPTDTAAQPARPGEPGAPCMIEALGFHAAEDPDRIRERLLIVAFSSNYPTRDAAARALNLLPATADIPFDIQVKAASTRITEREAAVRAALALGALKTLPGLVERALDDPESQVSRWPIEYLAHATDPEAFQLIARTIVRKPDDRDRLRLLQSHLPDVSMALATIALDESAAVPERQVALTVLGRDGDSVVLPMIEPLRRSPDPEWQSRAQAAGLALEQRKAHGQ